MLSMDIRKMLNNGDHLDVQDLKGAVIRLADEVESLQEQINNMEPEDA
jgi:hypothetical protein